MRSAVIALALVASTSIASAQPAQPAPPPPPAPAKLVVATHPIAPFIIKNADGSWSGISMDLWKQIAAQLHLEYEVKELEVKDLLEAGKTGTADVIVSLNISADREKEMDLTHAFYSTGLAIAVSPHAEDGLGATLEQIFTTKFAKLVGMLLLVLAGVGTLMWLIERKRNQAQFGGSPAKGIGAGLWWSAVTMTTVGYGDKAPVTIAGRVLGLIWMFTALIIISSFTAAIASALTVSQLESSINGPDDLPKATIGTVEPSSAARYCQRRGLSYKKYADAPAAVAALAKGDIDAVVFEAPILQYAARTEAGGKVTVLEGTFDNHGYGFGLKQGSPLREDINRTLLAITASDDWTQILVKYLGP
jgi:polar amino acid transport system substrate-binding protein